MRRILVVLAWAVAFYFAIWLMIRVGVSIYAASVDPQHYSAARAGAMGWTAAYVQAVVIAAAAGLSMWLGALRILPGVRDRLPAIPESSGRSFGFVAAGFFAAFLICVAAIHWLRPEMDPRLHFMSEYVNGPYGGVMTTAMVLAGLGGIVLANGLWRSITPSLWSFLG